MGLSANKEKDDRFQQKKKEVAEMIKMQPPSIDSEVYFSCLGKLVWMCYIYANSILDAAYVIWFIVIFILFPPLD